MFEAVVVRTALITAVLVLSPDHHGRCPPPGLLVARARDLPSSAERLATTLRREAPKEIDPLDFVKYVDEVARPPWEAAASLPQRAVEVTLTAHGGLASPTAVSRAAAIATPLASEHSSFFEMSRSSGLDPLNAIMSNISTSSMQAPAYTPIAASPTLAPVPDQLNPNITSYDNKSVHIAAEAAIKGENDIVDAERKKTLKGKKRKRSKTLTIILWIAGVLVVLLLCGIIVTVLYSMSDFDADKYIAKVQQRNREQAIRHQQAIHEQQVGAEGQEGYGESHDTHSEHPGYEAGSYH